MALEGARLFHSSKDGQTYLLQKHGNGGGTSYLYFSRLDDPSGGSSIPLLKKEIRKERNGLATYIRKTNNAGEVVHAKSLGKWEVGLKAPDGNGNMPKGYSLNLDRWGNFKGEMTRKPVDEIKAFCEQFGNVGKRIYVKYLKSLLKAVK